MRPKAESVLPSRLAALHSHLAAERNAGHVAAACLGGYTLKTMFPGCESWLQLSVNIFANLLEPQYSPLQNDSTISVPKWICEFNAAWST